MELIDNKLVIEEDIDPQSFPKLSVKFRPINSYHNTEHLLKHDKLSLRLNLMTHYPEYDCGGKLFKKREDLKYYLCYISNRCVEVGVPKPDLEMHLTWLAKQNEYHPAVDFIESKPWDGISRVNEFFNTVEAENRDLANRLLFRWMLGAVAAAFSEEGVSLGGVLVFQGAQFVGKTAWFLNLVPKSHQHLIKSGLSINPDDKDSVMNCTSCWMAELAEIDGSIRKSHAAAQKAFITQSVDYYRAPYDRSIISVPRRTAYFGSVNPASYLKDDTGNRRFWTIGVKSINYKHTIDMQQVWAEFKCLLDEGESYHLNEKEFLMLNEENESYETLDPLEEMILKHFKWDESERNNQMTASEVLMELGYSLTDFKIDTINKKCTSILTKLTGKKSRKSTKGRRIFELPR